MDGSGTPVLAARGLSKAFGPVRALRQVDLELYAGEVLGLVGDNGAGKSTLVKCIAAVHRADQGALYINGQLHTDLSPERVRELGIETVHQNLSLVDTLTVAQNLFLNQEMVQARPPGRWLGWLNRRAMQRRAQEILNSLGLPFSANQRVATLSGGQRQMVAVARAITWGRHIVMLDEPAAALGVRQSLQVLDFIRTLAARGIAVIFISHNMQHVLRVTDRIVVLRHGEKVGDLRTKETASHELVTLITGSDLVMPGQDDIV